MVETASLRCVFRVVRECDERVLFMHLCFMHASYSPLSGAFESASDALAARQFDVLCISMPCFLVEDYFTRACFVCVYRVVACHYSLQPPRIGVTCMFAAFVRRLLFRKLFALWFLLTLCLFSGFICSSILFSLVMLGNCPCAPITRIRCFCKFRICRSFRFLVPCLPGVRSRRAPFRESAG